MKNEKNLGVKRATFKRWSRVVFTMILASLCACALLLPGCGSEASSDATTTEGGTNEGAATSSTSEELIIGTMATEDILPMWVAEQEGIFAEVGLENVTIQTFQSAQELSTALAADAIDMAMTDIMVSATLTASGTPVTMQWVTLGTEANQGRFGIMTSPDSGITSLKELDGVPIGVGSCTVPEYVMDKLMEEAGVAPENIVGEEIKKVPVRFEMMTSNQVAAAALPGSLLALGEAQGMICLADDTKGENLSQSVMVMSEGLAATQQGKEMLEKAAEAWNNAVALINDNPEHYRSLLAEKAQLPEIIVDSYPISEYPTTQLPCDTMVTPVLDWMHEKGYLDKELGYDKKTGQFTQ